MKITIYGDHTPNNGEQPYKLAKEFEACLKRNWGTIEWFEFNSNNAADICLNITKVKELTVKQVLCLLRDAVEAAAEECEWDIWTVPYYEI